MKITKENIFKLKKVIKIKIKIILLYIINNYLSIIINLSIITK